ncbi:MAG: NAD(P)H-dependent oxidoreductase [Pseudolabrys sp.]|nr:NAD(P)H-dependent oxidoreductase [Pseudolabrys sp.]
MAKIAIIVGNPLHDSYSEALGEAYRRGAESGGHQANLFMLGRMNFDAILREGYRREQAMEPDLAAARAAFVACDHVVVIFPLWCGDMPAILKGFFERILQPDLLAIQKSGGKASWKIFKGKSARVIMTMGMPGWFYRIYYGAHALKLLKRNILKFIGITPVRSSVYGMIEAVSDDTRKSWLREVEALGHDAL